MSKFQKWMSAYVAREKITSRQAAVRFGVNDALVWHYLKGSRLPSYGTLQKIKQAVPDLDVNDLFD